MHATPDWLKFDRDHIWHPYAPVHSDAPLWPVVGAEGAEIELADGRRLIDGMASWWSVIHGYRHPVLNAALKAQVDRFAHVMFGGLTHEPAVQLAQRLLQITPDSLEHVFFADSGSVAVEVALKMAIQCWDGRGQPQRKAFLTIRNGYHGDTFGAMSVCDPENGMHKLFQGFLPTQYFAPAPPLRDEPDDGSALAAFEQQLQRHGNEIAAVILEPIVQGAGGMRIYRSSYLREVAALCRRYDTLLILDEIATGFGRTGELFGCHHADVSPDIMCVGKALTGGYMTLAATLVSDEVATDICRSDAGALMHGPTFMANPLACSVALASVDLLLSQDWQTRVRAMEQQITQGLSPCRDLPIVRDVRVIGSIGVVELASDELPPGLQESLVAAGVWVRPFRNLVYIMPPYVIREEQLSVLTGAIFEALSNSHIGVHARKRSAPLPQRRKLSNDTPLSQRGAGGD